MTLNIKKRRVIIQFILLFCISTLNTAVLRYVYNKMNDRTKQTFQKAGAVDTFILGENPSRNLPGDTPKFREENLAKFGGSIDGQLKGCTQYLWEAGWLYTRGGSENIVLAAWKLSVGIIWLLDILAPYNYGSCDSSIRNCAARFWNIDKPYNGTNKEVFNHNGEIISFGSPRTHTLTELELTYESFYNATGWYNFIIGLVDEQKINGTGDQVAKDEDNINIVRTLFEEWKGYVKTQSGNNLEQYIWDQRSVQMRTAAFFMKAVLAWIQGSQYYKIWFDSLGAYGELNSKPNSSESVSLPEKIPVEELIPPFSSAPRTNYGNNVLILDEYKNILSYVDLNDVEINETNGLGGFKTLTLETLMKNTKNDDEYYKQGNYLFINGDTDNERTLYVLNTEFKRNYTDNIINIDADEVLSELNNVQPFNIHDSRWDEYCYGNSLLVSKAFLTDLLRDYYIIDESTAIDLYDIEAAKRIINVHGTKSILSLLRDIEALTGCYFKTHYFIEDNKIINKIELLKPERYGKDHTLPVEAIRLGVNTNELEYTTNEEDNCMGVAPVLNKDDADDLKDDEYAEMVQDWFDFTANVNLDPSIDDSPNFGRGDTDDRIPAKGVDVLPYRKITQKNGIIPIMEEEAKPISLTPLNYLGKMYPKLTVFKSEGSSMVAITIRSTDIVGKEEIVQKIVFKDNVFWDADNHTRKTGIPADSPIVIDCNNQTINFTMTYYTTSESSITKTVNVANTETIKDTNLTEPYKDGVYCTCNKYPYGKKYLTIFKNVCPYCGKPLFWHASTSNRGAKTPDAEKELRCTYCGADFCGACGREKNYAHTKQLTVSGEPKVITTIQSNTETIKEVTNAWAELDYTVYPEGTSENTSDENKDRMSEFFTEDSDFFYLRGHVTIDLEGCYIDNDYNCLEASNASLYECAEFQYKKNAGEADIHTVDPVPFNYTQIGDQRKICNLELSAITIEDVLVELWDYFEGTSDKKDKLAVFEELGTEIIDNDYSKYDVGDIVYIKLENNKTYKTTVIKTTKNPNKRKEGSVEVGQPVYNEIFTWLPFAKGG